MQTTSPPPGAWIVAALDALVALESEVIVDHEEAVRNLRSPEIAASLTRHLEDHRRHLAALRDAIERFGGAAPGHTPRAHSLGGDDPALVRAVDDGERRAVVRYEDALRLRRLPTAVRRLLEVALDDERSHKRWTEAMLRAVSRSNRRSAEG